MDCKIIFGFILGVIGSFVGAFFTHIFSECRRRKEEFNKAAGEFRAAFAPAIAKFPLLKDANAIDAMLREEFIPQSVAIEKFRPFVPDNKKAAYQEAWENYHQSHKRNGVSSVYFLDYATGDEKNRFKLFNERIHAIRQFTK